MKIVIPMAGEGKRFQEQGYQQIKPLIEIEGKVMITHVVNLFDPLKDEFVFICREDHLERTQLKEVLESSVKHGKIVSIPAHHQGPVWSVLQAKNAVLDHEEVIVCYCDFSCVWNYQHFKKTMATDYYGGAIVCYTGFHPHMLGDTQYAFVREQDLELIEIQEKKPFTNNRLNEYASNGIYYFRQGRDLKECFQELVSRDLRVNGEFYVSLAFNLLLERGQKVRIYESPVMLQWGTPEDLEDFKLWQKTYQAYYSSSPPAKTYSMTRVLLMAGAGRRFEAADYPGPKALISFEGKPFYQHALQWHPKARTTRLVALKAHQVKVDGEEELIELEQLTRGQAESGFLGLAGVGDQEPILLASCDVGLIYSEGRFEELMKASDTVSFVTRPTRVHWNNPESYGWVRLEGERIKEVGVKKALKGSTDELYILTGSFWFRRCELYRRTFLELRARDQRVGNEYYIDSLIEKLVGEGQRCMGLVVDGHLGWGSPDELKTHQYWLRYFKPMGFE